MGFDKDARWFTRQEVLEVLRHPNGTVLSPRGSKRLDEIVSGQTVEEGGSQAVEAGVVAKSQNDEPPFRVPPRSSIAGMLISEWAYGKSRL
jgi:NAD+ diphosphatase